MIQEETFYAIKCDGCKLVAEKGNGYPFWADKDTSIENAMESGWHIEGDTHYCQECHYFDDKDNLIILKK